MSLSILSFIIILIRNLHCKASLSSDRYREVEVTPNLSKFRFSCFISQIFRDLVSSEQCCEQIFKNEVLNELSIQIHKIINIKKVTPVDEVSFLSIAVILSDIASSDQGKKFILQNYSINDTQNSKSRKSNSNSCQLLEDIASFVEKSLLGTQENKLSSKVLGSSIFFLRQFYRTWEGLIRVRRFNLHISLAKSRVSPDSPVYDETFDSILIDNLLNFGATAEGVVLLHNSGSMVPCVAYMLAR
jgi:hypothetical protein